MGEWSFDPDERNAYHISYWPKGDPRGFGEFCLTCNYRLFWNGQRALICHNIKCPKFGLNEMVRVDPPTKEPHEPPPQDSLP